MPSYENLIRRILKNPTDMRIEEAKRILVREGWRHARTTGSHEIYSKKGERRPLVIPIHGIYLKRYCAIELINALDLQEKYGDE